MKRILFLFLIGLIKISNAQVKINSEIDLSAFPEIKFELNNRNPNLVSESAFEFFEIVDGESLKNENYLINKVEDSTNYKAQNKCVLILFEFLKNSERKEQNYTFKEALIESLDSIVKQGDKFKIVAFSLKNKETKILKNISDDFTDNTSLLKESLEFYSESTNDFNNKIDILNILFLYKIIYHIDDSGGFYNII